jgi:general secretion pathway protein C
MNTLADLFPKSFSLNSLNLVKLNQMLPPAITLILIIACSYTLSQITWSLIPGDEQQSAPRSVQKNTRNNQPVNNHKEITDAHLFGTFVEGSVVVTQKAAPDTRLNLVLKGVLATNPMEYGSAIISMGKNGKEDTFVPGDKVSSATLKEIYADRVILQRGGKLETLRMPKDNSASLIRSTPASAQANTPDLSTPGAVLSDIRKQILKNPTSFGKYAIPVPFNKNGKLIGYRLQPQGDKALFEAVGLERNDVILAVNGISLKNPAKGLKALRSLQRAKSINLTILRNGSEMPLQFEIP